MATVVFAVGVAALVPLIVGSVRAARTARDAGLSAWMASQKLEQLRGLVYARDQMGTPVTDTWTDTAREPVVHAGGTGLSPSPSSSLTRDTPGYVDYLDERGGRSPGPNVYTRRWSIGPAWPGQDDLVRIVVSVRHAISPGVPVTVATLKARRTP